MSSNLSKELNESRMKQLRLLNRCILVFSARHGVTPEVLRKGGEHKMWEDNEKEEYWFHNIMICRSELIRENDTFRYDITAPQYIIDELGRKKLSDSIAEKLEILGWRDFK
jgi:hypothetical protein